MRDFSEPALAGVHVTQDMAGLAAIHAPDCAAVIWAQPDCPALFDWLAALPADKLPQMRQILRAEAAASVLHEVCACMPEGRERVTFIKNVAALAERFADVMRAPWLRLRLEVVTDNACRKFHIDNVTARLVCTYRGTGTQLGIAARGAEPEVVATMPTGQPLILRGMRWPTTPPSLLKHRSPPIAGTGETRLLLVLDPIREPEVED